MTWLAVALLGLVTFVATNWLLPAPRSARTAIGAALMLGVAGYAAQSHPELPGSPTAPRETRIVKPGAIEARQKLSDAPAGADNRLIIADAMARNGHYASAVTVLNGVVDKDPGNAEAWLAMANALVSHADSNLSPAAMVAYRRAGDAAPGNPGPPFFLGLALVQSGRLEEARREWADLLARSPEGSAWREDLVFRLAQLDSFIAEQAVSARQRP
jgi:cytochrome c-type biogenesis protein CcmH